VGKGVRIEVYQRPDLLGETLRGKEDRGGWGLDLMGVPLLQYSLTKLAEARGPIQSITLPPSLHSAQGLLRSVLPDAEVQVGAKMGHRNGYGIRLPTDGLIVPNDRDELRVQSIVEPWDLLNSFTETLKRDVNTMIISPSADVAKTAVISGPCMICDDVLIDDFCKIKGPVFIGPRTKVWTGSLVRESMLGPDCEVGFSCEIGRTYMLGGDRVAHHDVILDSVLGQNVWMGALIGTTNMLLNNSNVRYKEDRDLVDTGLQHFGAVFGHDSAVGAGTIILPGRFIPPKAIVQAGTVYSSPADAQP
jgi:bifunctional UDP-N-acetylglucosamine pyrophosphorylase/glucosamine-1-phosphate N-acetyltransferase